MKHFIAPLILVFAFIFNLVSAQTVTPLDDLPFIEVVGIAEREVVPDEIFIAVTLIERTENKETITIDQQESELKAALKGIGLAENQLYLSDANANYIRIKRTKKGVVNSREYLIKVGNAAIVSKVFESLDNLNITRAAISKVSHSKILELKKEVRIAAIKAAKAKANYLLTAIGEEVGSPIIIREQSSGVVNDNYNYNVRGFSNQVIIDGVKVRSPELNEIQFKKIKLQATMFTKFKIK